jgi:hypothetical protein
MPARSLFAQSVVTVVNNGDPNNRIDITILGDGYTAGEMSKYAADVSTLVGSIFAQDPYLEYQNYYNIHRVDVASNESGVDHPERTPPVFKNTAFDASYNCSGIQRLICVTTSKVLTVASNVLTPAQRDIILVLVNDSEYGGSGGTLAVASTHPLVVEIVLHEVGHSFGLLADEYGGPPPPSCSTSSEPSEPNATIQNQRNSIKWVAWIDAATPIPTTTTLAGIAGLYQGAQYCDSGKYRPTYNSKMRSLGLPFEQINTEQLIKRIYNLVSPLDSSSPSATSLSLIRGQTQAFSATMLAPRTHGISVEWYVDGQLKGGNASYTLDSTDLNPGSHTAMLLAEDKTASVRNDPAGVLREQKTWDLNITPSSLDSPTIASITPASTTAGTQNIILVVNGTNFINGSVVRWNGNTRTTTYVSSTNLTCSIPASDLAAGGTAQVTVFNSAPVSGPSNAVVFSVLDFSLAMDSSTSTVSAGQTALYKLTINPISGFDRGISLSCTGAPSGTSCSVNPSSFTMNGTNSPTASIQIATTARSFIPAPPGNLDFTKLYMLGLLVSIFIASVIRTRLIPKIAILMFSIALVSCGGNSGSTQVRGTPAGTYTLTVTATSGSLSHDTKMTLTVR